jgi:amino acid transporter
MNPTLLIVLGILFLVIGIALLAYFGIKYVDHKKKSTTNTVLMVIGGILLVIGIAFIIWYVITTRRSKKQKLADAGIEIAALPDMPVMENAYTSGAVMPNRMALMARTPPMPPRYGPMY